MRPEVVAPPDDDRSLASLPVHVVVRDFPEALLVLRAEGADLRRHGTQPLEEAGPGVVAAVARALEWRRRV